MEISNVLSKRENLSIEQRSCCDNIIFHYQNLLLKFSPDSFDKFVEALTKQDFKERAVTFGDDSEKMIINTQLKEVQMCFERDEFKTICYALEEALVMLEVNNILYT